MLPLRFPILKLALSAGKPEHEMGDCCKLHEQLRITILHCVAPLDQCYALFCLSIKDRFWNHGTHRTHETHGMEAIKKTGCFSVCSVVATN
jgi:hypothetical protein